MTDKYDVLELKSLIEEHTRETGSKKGRLICDSFSDYLPHFKKIVPYDYKKMLTTIARLEEKGLSYEQAEIEAFSLITQ